VKARSFPTFEQLAMKESREDGYNEYTDGLGIKLNTVIHTAAAGDRKNEIVILISESFFLSQAAHLP